MQHSDFSPNSALEVRLYFSTCFRNPDSENMCKRSWASRADLGENLLCCIFWDTLYIVEFKVESKGDIKDLEAGPIVSPSTSV